MTTFDLDHIRRDIASEPGETWQALVNLGYDEWQKHDDWSMEDMINFARLTYGEVVEMAILLSKYDQQICNGGHSQYLGNSYSGEELGSYVDNYDYNVPRTRRMESLMEKFNLHTTSYGANVHSIIHDFINRTHGWDSSTSQEMVDEDEDNSMPSYEDLDDSYYLVNEWWEHEMKRYFGLWMEFGEDPIATGRF